MVEVIIRAALVEDAESVKIAYLKSWRAGYEGLLPPDRLEQELASRASLDWRAQIVAEKDSSIFVADRDGAVLGLVQFDHVTTHSGQPSEDAFT